MKKLFYSGLAFAAAALPALAEEVGGNPSDPVVSVDAVKGVFSTARTSMASLMNEAIPVAIAFVGGGLIIWGALALVSVLKRGLSAGKGR